MRPPGSRANLASSSGWSAGFSVGVAVDELDRVIALVHAVLDQRIAGQRADHEDARRGRFELGESVGKASRSLAGELDAAAFDEPARRGRADSRDDPVAADALLAIAGGQRDPAGLDRLGLGLVA